MLCYRLKDSGSAVSGRPCPTLSRTRPSWRAARQQQATAAFWRGKLAARQGRFELAETEAEEFAALLAEDDNPRKMEPYHELHGLISLMQEDYDAAVGHYRQANLSTSPTVGNVKNIYLLARAMQGAGKTEEAGELLEQAANWNFNSAWFAMIRSDASDAV
jgi:tetratricopeptide (TPR) repeat protein